MKRTLVTVACALCSLATQAFATECSNGGPPAKPAFDLKVIAASLDNKADAINAWWTEGRDGLPLSDALIQRQERIDKVYADFAGERHQLYSGLSCTIVSTKKCASTPGKKKHCPMSIEPPSSNTQFDASKMEVIDDDFSVAPHLAGSAIQYTVKKTGNGSNTAGFKAPVVYKSGAVQDFVDSELKKVQEYFQAKVSLSAPLGVITSNGLSGNGSSNGSCSNLAEQLTSLAKLRESGGLTQLQYDTAVNKVTNACT